MSYYNECRKAERELRQFSKDAKQRFERKRDYFAKRSGDPLQRLRLHGQSCRVTRDADQHHLVNSGKSLVPWQGKREVMIDRFDARSALDVIHEYTGPEPAPPANREQAELEAMLNYERYRSVIEAEATGLNEREHVKAVSAEIAMKLMEMDRVFDKVKQRGAAEAAPKKPVDSYARVGFSYGTDSKVDSSAVDDDPASGDEDSGDDDDSDKPNRADDGTVNVMAAGYGVPGYTDIRAFDTRQQQRRHLLAKLKADSERSGRSLSITSEELDALLPKAPGAAAAASGAGAGARGSAARAAAAGTKRKGGAASGRKADKHASKTSKSAKSGRAQIITSFPLHNDDDDDDDDDDSEEEDPSNSFIIGGSGGGGGRTQAAGEAGIRAPSIATMEQFFPELMAGTCVRDAGQTVLSVMYACCTYQASDHCSLPSCYC